ncbi:MAG: lipocalin-like domain-containing protein [Xanthobacteraceae bacterium]
MTAEDILGTWCSVGHERVTQDGTVTHPFGKEPLPARLVYSPDGSMAVMTIRPGLEKLRRGTPADVRLAALDECIGYMGHYDVVGSTIRHHIEVSINPELIGVTLERPVISAEGNRVTVRAPGDKNGALDNITWERLTR